MLLWSFHLLVELNHAAPFGIAMLFPECYEVSYFEKANVLFDYGQTLFLDGILMDIMIDNGQIWCKLSA